MVALFLVGLCLVKAYTIIDPTTGLQVALLSSTELQVAQNRYRHQFFQRDQDVQRVQPRQRVPAPEYYASDGQTPIYKLFKRNPYGR